MSGSEESPLGFMGQSWGNQMSEVCGFLCRLRAPTREGEAGAGGVPAAQRQRGPAAAGGAAGAGAGQCPGAGSQGRGRAPEETSLRGEGGAAAGSPGAAPGRLREAGAAGAAAPHPPGAGAEDAAGSAGGCWQSCGGSSEARRVPRPPAASSSSLGLCSGCYRGRRAP